MGRAAKATLEIKQFMIKLRLQHPHFFDFQISQIISERFAIHIARAPINLNSIKYPWVAIKRKLT
jgi:hypothetical protein